MSMHHTISHEIPGPVASALARKPLRHAARMTVKHSGHPAYHFLEEWWIGLLLSGGAACSLSPPRCERGSPISDL
jgi:hypothetical protein